jgi:hypothetical protein
VLLLGLPFVARRAGRLTSSIEPPPDRGDSCAKLAIAERGQVRQRADRDVALELAKCKTRPYSGARGSSRIERSRVVRQCSGNRNARFRRVVGYRTCNVEVAFDLEAMERHPGVAIRAAKVIKYLNGPFARWLGFRIPSELPEEHESRLIWVWPNLGRSTMPRLAREYELTVGHQEGGARWPVPRRDGRRADRAAPSASGRASRICQARLPAAATVCSSQCEA